MKKLVLIVVVLLIPCVSYAKDFPTAKMRCVENCFGAESLQFHTSGLVDVSASGHSATIYWKSISEKTLAVSDDKATWEEVEYRENTNTLELYDTAKKAWMKFISN